jgi:hypothetical protein
MRSAARPERGQEVYRTIRIVAVGGAGLSLRLIGAWLPARGSGVHAIRIVIDATDAVVGVYLMMTLFIAMACVRMRRARTGDGPQLPWLNARHALAGPASFGLLRDVEACRPLRVTRSALRGAGMVACHAIYVAHMKRLSRREGEGATGPLPSTRPRVVRASSGFKVTSGVLTGVAPTPRPNMTSLPQSVETVDRPPWEHRSPGLPRRPERRRPLKITRRASEDEGR